MCPDLARACLLSWGQWTGHHRPLEAPLLCSWSQDAILPAAGAKGVGPGSGAVSSGPLSRWIWAGQWSMGPAVLLALGSALGCGSCCVLGSAFTHAAVLRGRTAGVGLRATWACSVLVTVLQGPSGTCWGHPWGVAHA